jgi:ABC-type transport system involved in cytochrome c biogenesis permease subunit
MVIKYTLLGLLVYLALAGYILAFLLTIAGSRKTGQFIYRMGFIVTAAAFAFRWYEVGHVPFQNMFEVFLSMGMLVYPLSVFCRRFLDAGGQAADAFIGAILLFAAGFVFPSEPQMLPPALQCRLFAPHVAVYLLAYVVMTKAAVQAFCQLKAGPDERILEYERNTYRIICLGFPLLTLGLILGSWWGKLAWGDYWGWDPKELWSLASWLVYVAYLHFRYVFGQKHPRINSCMVLMGFAAIMITLLWVNLSGIFAGLHNYAS